MEKKILAKHKNNGQVFLKILIFYNGNKARKAFKQKKRITKITVFLSIERMAFFKYDFFVPRKDSGRKLFFNNFSIQPKQLSTQDRTKKIALIFDVMENSRGLDTVLFSLKEHKTPATFFLRANLFIMNQWLQKELSQQDIKGASLFISPINLSDSKYHDTKLYWSGWHTRGCFLSYDWCRAFTLLAYTILYIISEREICSWEKAAGYRFVVPTMILPDWLPPAKTPAELRQSSYEMVNEIMQNLKR